VYFPGPERKGGKKGARKGGHLWEEKESLFDIIPSIMRKEDASLYSRRNALNLSTNRRQSLGLKGDARKGVVRPKNREKNKLKSIGGDDLPEGELKLDARSDTDHRGGHSVLSTRKQL